MPGIVLSPGATEVNKSPCLLELTDRRGTNKQGNIKYVRW